MLKLVVNFKTGETKTYMLTLGTLIDFVEKSLRENEEITSWSAKPIK